VHAVAGDEGAAERARDHRIRLAAIGVKAWSLFRSFGRRLVLIPPRRLPLPRRLWLRPHPAARLAQSYAFTCSDRKLIAIHLLSPDKF
jgi:hypothetical protein